MEKAKFTPGPWTVSTHADNDNVVIRDKADAIVCNVSVDSLRDWGMILEEHEEINEANAQLIAAAPDMLEVLRLVFKAETSARHDNKNILTDAGYNKIKQAIAKAEGN